MNKLKKIFDSQLLRWVFFGCRAGWPSLGRCQELGVFGLRVGGIAMAYRLC